MMGQVQSGLRRTVEVRMLPLDSQDKEDMIRVEPKTQQYHVRKNQRQTCKNTRLRKFGLKISVSSN